MFHKYLLYVIYSYIDIFFVRLIMPKKEPSYNETIFGAVNPYLKGSQAKLLSQQSIDEHKLNRLFAQTTTDYFQAGFQARKNALFAETTNPYQPGRKSLIFDNRHYNLVNSKTEDRELGDFLIPKNIAGHLDTGEKKYNRLFKNKSIAFYPEVAVFPESAHTRKVSIHNGVATSDLGKLKTGNRLLLLTKDRNEK